MSNIILGICNNMDLMNFQYMIDNFPYYDVTKIDIKLNSSLDMYLEYLVLINTFGNVEYGNSSESLNIPSYDEFIEYKCETILTNLDEYLDINGIGNSQINSNMVPVVNSVNDSVDFDKFGEIYDIKQYENSKQLNLNEWFDESEVDEDITCMGDVYCNLTDNMEFNFVMACYNYAQKVMPKYSSKYSKKKFNQHQLFAILAYKIYNNKKYRDVMDSLELSTKLLRSLKLKEVPHFTTLQKFFDKLEIKYIRAIDKILLSFFPVKNCIFSLDGSGMTNSYSDIYYNRRTNKTKRSYIKNHITIDSEYLLIRHSQALNGGRHDTVFSLAAVNAIKKYKPRYVLADKAYDAEYLRKEINEETTALAMIPVKKNPQTGKHRLNSEAIFRPMIYRFRNQVECVFSILKRKFSGINTSRSTTLGKKETLFKNLLYNIYRTIQIIIGSINRKTTTN